MTITQGIPKKMPNQNNVLRQPQTYDCIELANWIWVIDQKRFVLMHDPAKLPLDKHQFNEAFRYQFTLPHNMLPNTYIRSYLRNDRVVTRMDMCPDRKELMYVDEDNLKVLNVFQQPPQGEGKIAPQSTVEFLLEFISYLLNKDQEAVDHLLKWITHFLFKPGTRMHHGILLSGDQGTGKSTLGRIVSELGGSSSTVITPQEIKGTFQNWMLNSRLVIVEEVKQQKAHEFYNNMKVYFTNDKNRANLKNLPAINITNHLHWMMFSNYSNPINLDADDRRIFYVHSNAVKRDKEYYSKLNKYLFDDGGIWAFRKYLELNYLPKLNDDFAYQISYQTQDHINAGVDSRSRLEEIIEAELDEATGLFTPNLWFYFSNLKEYLDAKNLSILKDNATTNAILSQYLVKVRKTIEGKKPYVCWWKEYDSVVRPLFDDLTYEGRKKLMKAKCIGYIP